MLCAPKVPSASFHPDLPSRAPEYASGTPCRVGRLKRSIYLPLLLSSLSLPLLSLSLHLPILLLCLSLSPHPVTLSLSVPHPVTLSLSVPHSVSLSLLSPGSVSHLDQLLNFSLYRHLKMLVSGGLETPASQLFQGHRVTLVWLTQTSARQFDAAAAWWWLNWAYFKKFNCKQHKLSLEMMGRIF